MSEFSRSAVSAVSAFGVLLRWLAKWVLLACAVAVLAGASAHFHVVGLEQCAALGVPVGLQLQDDLLEGQHAFVWHGSKAMRGWCVWVRLVLRKIP